MNQLNGHDKPKIDQNQALVNYWKQLLPLENIVQRAFDGFVLIDENQKIIGFSPGVDTLFQYMPTELTGQPLDLLIPLPDVETHRRHVVDFLNGEESSRPMHGKLRVISCRRKDGHIFPAEATIAKAEIPDQEGRYVLGAFLRNVTERVQYQEKIVESARFSQGILDAQTAHICVLDEQGAIIAVNKAWRDFATANGGDLTRVGEGVNYLAVAETAVGENAEESIIMADGIRAVMNGERDRFTIEYPCHSPDERRWFVALITRMFGADTDKPRIVIVHENISQRKKIEEAFFQAQKLESLGIFAAGIAHDFNNILTAIIAQSSLASFQLDRSEEVQEKLTSIAHIARQGTNITRQLLDYSGEGQIVTRLVDLNATIAENLPLLEMAINHKGILDVHLAPQEMPILADTGQLQQVLMNLVINASEAYDDEIGVVTLRTEIIEQTPASLSHAFPDATLPQRYVCLYVSDQGKGMDATTQTRIFDPFFTTKKSGHGLGLAAVIGIIRGMNGHIELVSEVGKGSTFQIFLPYQGSPAHIEAHHSSQGPITRSRILLADDERSVRTAVGEYLRLSGYNVVVAVSGQEAIQHYDADRTEYVLAILDVTMPDISGYDVYQHICRFRPELPIIFLSGYNKKEMASPDKKNLLFLKKPFQLNDLTNAIEQLLQAADSQQRP